MRQDGGDRRSGSVAVYAGAVALAGTAVLTAAITTGAVRDIVHASAGFWLFAALLLAGELFQISIPHGGEVDEITTSTTFAFAVLIAFGTGPAVLAQSAASIVSDIVYRKPAWKIAFNAGQYAVSLGIAGWLYTGLGGAHAVSTSILAPFALAAVVFFLLNTIITDVGIALSLRIPIAAYLVRDLQLQVFVTPTLLALAPVVVAAAEITLWLVPLAAVPAVAVYWGTRQALENARLVEELKASLEQMTELNRMKDDFVAVVSHELRTPLTSIQGYIKTMLQLSPELPDEQRRSFLEAADRQSERLRRLIEQLLVVSRLESHVEPLVWQPVSLARVTAQVVDELRPRAHGHTFDVRMPPTLPEVETDEAKLHQILSNLVENALKYSPPDTRIGLRAEPGVRGVVITVQDEGPGIPPEAHERVFERFFQVDSSHTRRQGGTGLGLYICRKMAEAIGARIWLARSDASGSEFCVFVPERQAGGEDRGATRSPAADQSMIASV